MRYKGNFVISEKTKLQGSRIAPGEIIVCRTNKGEPSGQLIFRCPYCNATQFRAGKVEGEKGTPTVTTPLTCSCKQWCGVTFRIRSGKIQEEEEEERTESPELSEQLSNAGVFYPSKS